MAELRAEMMAVLPLLVAHFAARARLMGYFTRILVALQIAFVSARKKELAFVEAKRLSSTRSWDLFLAASAGNRHVFVAFAWTIMAHVQASVATRQLFIADVVAFGHDSPADDRRLEESQTAGTGLRLTVNDWAPLAKAHVACLSALMFFAVEHLVAGLLAGMIVEDG